MPLQEHKHISASEPISAKHKPTILTLLRNRHFLLYILSILFNFVAFGLHSLGRAWLMEELTGSPFLVALVQVVSFSPLIIFTVFGGVIADWLNRKVIILISDIAYLLSYAALVALFFAEVVQPWHVLSLAAFNGTAFALSVSSRQTLYSQIVPKEYTRAAASTYTVAINLANVVAPALGLVLLPVTGIGNTLIASMVALGVAMLVLVPVKLKPREDGQSHHATIFKDLKYGISYVRGKPALRLLLAMVFVSVLTLGPLNALLPSYADQVLGAGSLGYSLLVFGSGLGSIAGSLAVAFFSNMDFKKFGFIFGGLSAVMMLTFAFSFSLPLSVAIILVRGFAVGGFLSLNLATTVSLVPADVRGRVMSIRFMLLGVSPVGSLTIGILGENFGVQLATMVMAGAGIALIFALLVFEYRYLAMDMMKGKKVRP